MTKARNHLFLMAAALVVALSTPSYAEDEKPTLLIADNDWRPWFNGPENVESPGFAKEIIQRCVTVAGYDPTFKQFPIKRMISMMQSGAMDISIFSFKPGRTEFLAYSSEPLFFESYVPFVKKGSGIKIKKIADFDPLRLGHMNGLTYSKDYFAYIKQRQKAKKIDITIDSESNILKLASGRIDVFVDTRASVTSLLNRMGLTDQIKSVDYTVKSGEYFITLSKQSKNVPDIPGFLAEIDDCIKNMKNNLEYSELAAHYGLQPSDILTAPHNAN